MSLAESAIVLSRALLSPIGNISLRICVIFGFVIFRNFSYPV